MERRGFENLTAVQRAVLDAAPAGGNLRVSSQTGSGKTVAIGLALADQFLDGQRSRGAGPAALIITPTRELAVQVRDELRWLFEDAGRIRVEVVTGGTDIGRERSMLRRNPDILVATPGRLLDHMRAEAVRCEEVGHVVLDEADRMLDMGFREDLEAIVDALPEGRASHLVSATFPDAVRRLADRFQSEAIHVQGTALGSANADIEHVAHLVDRDEKYAALVNLLLLANGERVLVFVERRADVAMVAQKLARDGFAAQPFSGELSQAQRTRALESFRVGTLDILVSTDVAARGIDVPGISTVIHGDVPTDAETYTHRSGRTGRAGAKGRSLLLVQPRARYHVRRILEAAKIDAEWEPVPSPNKVRKALKKQGRRALRARLAAGNEPPEHLVEYAASLLEEMDAAHVVATLLEMAAPRLPREPMDVTAIDPNEVQDRRGPRHGPGPGARKHGPPAKRGRIGGRPGGSRFRGKPGRSRDRQD